VITTGKFNFIHLHKTGGQFVAKVLSEYFPDCQVLGYHYPRHMLPERCKHLPIIGFVRNPWAWYVSWYAFNHTRSNGNPLFTVMSNGGRNEFASTLRNMLSFGDDTPASKSRREQLINLLPDSIEGNISIGLTKHCLAETDGSYYQWLIRRMFGLDGKYDDVIFGKTETLREDLLGIMRKLGIDVPEAAKQFILTAAPVNASPHRAYQQYYTESLAQQVAEREAQIIRRFDYNFAAP
jgi:hypothetical protein